ncbi:hypothetical protein EIP91_002853 [Steccherinum ochraceum]|uniref:Uncharacterized protein n=1 Tax=Steccherinum ochraceum TaxID=92696 RepID=A0A4R0RBF7_9APHY|nr:hypothetical protein EIP91_002853 [Steccherinum ochraceum]
MVEEISKLGAEESPSIRDLIIRSLDGKWDMCPTFSFMKSYDAAPNPTLTLENGETIGLPLSERDAVVIKQWAEKVTSGEAAGSAKGPWEVDAAQITLAHPKWAAFVEQAGYDFCEALDIEYPTIDGTSKPEFKLDKLFLYESGSSLLPHVTLEKHENVFANILIFLPSKFTGGDIHLSHSELTAVRNFSEDSLFQTTVISWFSDVIQEVKPVASGYRLALAYSVIHTSTSRPRPVFSIDPEDIRQLREAMTSWKRAVESKDDSFTTPEKLVILLAAKYPKYQAPEDLDEDDANRVSTLALLANHLGFSAAFANLEWSIHGVGEIVQEPAICRGRWPYGYDRRKKAYRLEFKKVKSTKVDILELVDLEGKSLEYKLDLSEAALATEGVPADLTKAVQGGRHDTQDPEMDHSAEDRKLTRSFRRTVIVIWPPASAISIRYGGDLPGACSVLRSSWAKANHPTTEDIALIDFLLSRGRTSQHAVLVSSTLCEAAVNCNDADLWLRAIRACSKPGKGLAIIKVDGGYNALQRAIETFGFAKVEPGLDIMLQDDSRNTRRFACLNALEKWVSDDKQKDHETAIVPWIQLNRATALNSLRVPRSKDDVLFVSLAARHGGITFIRDTVLTQIKQSACPLFLMNFAIKVLDEPMFSEDNDLRADVASSIMQYAISRAPLNRAPKSPPSWIEPTRKNANYKTARLFLQACLGKFDGLIHIICQKIADIFTAEYPEEERVGQVTDVMVPILHDTALYVRRNPKTAVPNLQTYLCWVLKPYMNRLAKGPVSSMQDYVMPFVTAMSLPGGFDICAPYMVEKVDRFSAEILLRFVEEIIKQSEHLVPQKRKTPPKAVLLSKLVNRYASTGRFTSSKAIVDVVEYCLKCSPGKTHLLLQRLTVSATVGSTHESPPPVLLSSLQYLHRLALDYRPSLFEDPFPLFFRTIMNDWMKHEFVPRPAVKTNSAADRVATLDRTLCANSVCEDCTSLRAFLTGLSEETEKLRLDNIGAKRKNHLTRKLERLPSLCAFVVTRDRSSGITITKFEDMYWTKKWQASRAQGMEILENISGGDTEELQLVLGDSYEYIVPPIRGYGCRSTGAKRTGEDDYQPRHSKRVKAGPIEPA